MTSWKVNGKGAGVAVCAVSLALLVVIGGNGQSAASAAAKPADQIVPPSGQGVTAGKGVLADEKGIRINPAAVRSFLTGSASLSFGSIGANGGCSSRAIPVTGAVIGDKLVLGTPAELLTYSLAMTYAVSAADTVTIRLCNYTSSSISPPSWTWNVDVVKSF